MKKIITVLFLVLIVLFVNAEGTNFILSEMGYSADVSGTGETGVVYNNSVSSLKTNSALLSVIENTEIKWTHSDLNYSQWNDYISAGISKNTDNFNFGFGMYWNRLWVDGIPVTEIGDTIIGTDYVEIIQNGETNYTLNEYGFAFAVDYSGIKTGVVFKLINGNLYTYDVDGYGFDIGTHYYYDLSIPYINGIGMGLVLKDITGTKLEWSTGTEETTDMILNAGIGFDMNLPSIDNKIEMEFNVERIFDNAGTMTYKGGGTFYIFPIIPLRVGYNGNGITGGLGINTENITIDYSYTGMSEIDPIHKISIGLLF